MKLLKSFTWKKQKSIEEIPKYPKISCKTLFTFLFYDLKFKKVIFMVEKTILVEKKKEMKEEIVDKKLLEKASQKLEEKRDEKVIVLKVEEKVEEKKQLNKEISIEELPGVGAATAEKLREAGFSDLMGLAVASPGILAEVAGVGEAAARKIINTARNKLDMGFESGEDLLIQREKVVRITTG